MHAGFELHGPVVTPTCSRYSRLLARALPARYSASRAGIGALRCDATASTHTSRLNDTQAADDLSSAAQHLQPRESHSQAAHAPSDSHAPCSEEAAADQQHAAEAAAHGHDAARHAGEIVHAMRPPHIQNSAAKADISYVDMDPAALFPSRHIPHWSPLLAAYLPFGCAIGAVRMALWVVLLAVDSPLLTDNDAMIRVLHTVLGIRVSWHGTENLPAGRHVIVSNHVTVGDLMVLYAAPRPYVHLITSKLPRRITQAQHHRVKLRHASGATYCQLADSAAHPDPVHLFPEGGMTSGAGMMRFSRGFMRFGKDLPIAPAAMRAQAAFGINTHTLTSSFLANMFWFCFAPWVSLDITVLPPMHLREGEGNGRFVERVQQAVAAELGVPVADMTLQQKHKLHG